jgi:hypothetical protein
MKKVAGISHYFLKGLIFGGQEFLIPTEGLVLDVFDSVF